MRKCGVQGPPRLLNVAAGAGRARRSFRCPAAGQRNHERAGGKRQPGGLLRAAQSDPQARRKEACAQWALGPKAQSDLEA